MSEKLNLKEKLLLAIVPPLATGIIKFLALTMKMEVLHEDRVKSFWQENKRMILVFWHGRLLMIPFCYHGTGIKTLISQHKDGELLARTMTLFGHESVRGSTTRGGSKAMREMVKAMKTHDIALTPDGPRGPKYKVQDGVIALSRITGVPIVPVTFSATKKKFFQSWDSFLLPYPFSKGVFMWGEPLYITKEDDMKKKKLELEKQMIEMKDYVDSYVEK